MIARTLSVREGCAAFSGVSPRTARFGILVLAYAISSCACSGSGKDAQRQISPVYDSKTGRLQLLKLDSNGNGTVDTWSYMDGAHVVRIEIDQNEDGKIDRWEYYDAATHLIRVGLSRADTGKEDAWTYLAADGSEVVKLELAGKTGRIRRTEHYEHDRLVSAEEDTDEDGQVDKWETYAAGRLASVAFDTLHRGTPERRLVYGADGSARVEHVAR